jgi:hypothetical protein
VKDAPREMPGVWLMLLDLCRTHGREQMFRAIASEFHERFNVRMPQWHHFPPGREDPGLEAYPRLIKQITLVWGTHECCRLLDGLLYDNRGSRRVGFALNAYQDLIALRRAAQAVLLSIDAEAAASVPAAAHAPASPSAIPTEHTAPAAPLVQELVSQLDGDLSRALPAHSVIEREHPALAGMLQREWGNAAVRARIDEMLARGGDGVLTLSPEARAELEVVRSLAVRIGDDASRTDAPDAPRRRSARPA